MKSLLSAVFAFCLAASLLAQVPGEALPSRTPAELERLVSPIALYPDSLVALILPAATDSSEVVLAARFLASNNDPAQIDAQNWEDSVKALARYPTIVRWMDENLQWTRDIGEAFLAQPTDVMNAVQRLRAQARANGELTDTPQQSVVVEDNTIEIEPTQPNVIYVPYYDPNIFWEPRRPYGPFISFGVGCAVGPWLHYDCNWHDRVVIVHRVTPGWVYHPRLSERHHQPIYDIWHPDPRRVYPENRYVHRPPADGRPGWVEPARGTYEHRGNTVVQDGRPVTPGWTRSGPLAPPNATVARPAVPVRPGEGSNPSANREWHEHARPHDGQAQAAPIPRVSGPVNAPVARPPVHDSRQYVRQITPSASAPATPPPQAQPQAAPAAPAAPAAQNSNPPQNQNYDAQRTSRVLH